MLQLSFRPHFSNYFLRLALLLAVFFIAFTNRLLAAESTSISTSTTTEERAFTRDTLYALLTAEIAGSRQRYDLALTQYVQQAKITRDPQVVERATMIARSLDTKPRSLEAPSVSLEMSLLWAEVAATDERALTNAAVVLLEAGQLLEAFDMSTRAYNLGGEPIFQNIAAKASQLNPAQREQLLQTLLTLLPTYNHDEQVLVSLGLLMQQDRKFDAAMNYVYQALQAFPRSIPAATLEASLLHDLGRDSEAIAKMGELLNFYPDNISLRERYAQILSSRDLAKAQQQFGILCSTPIENADACLSMGIIAMQRKDNKSAYIALNKLLDLEQHTSTAHYYLGQLAEREKRLQEAVINYLQVEDGNDFLPATLSLLDVLLRQKDLQTTADHMSRLRFRFPAQAESLYQLEVQALIKHQFLNEALQRLNKALNLMPNSTKLLYARGLLHGQMGQNAEAERDLRAFLKLDPANPVALNALGYWLSDKPERHMEAEVLLTKALSLTPEDTVIIDSLGWLHFQMGRYKDALQELRNAYTKNKDPAVSAHYGEALWTLGAKEEAKKVWSQSLKRNPKDSAVPDTLKRLKVEL